MLVLAAAVFGGYAYLHSHGGKLDLNGGGGGTGGSSTSGTGSGSEPGSGSEAAGGTAFVFTTGTTVEPLIYQFIDSARSSIDMTMYELSDASAINDLIARKKAGVDVRVVLDQTEKSTNESAYAKLTSAGIGVTWSSTAFQYTHQKTLTVDDHKSLILTGNLTSNYYSETRDYGDLDSDANDVKAIVGVFDADYAHKPITPSDADDLLWSPTTAQSHVLSIIDGAHKTLDVEGEEFNDSAVVDAVAAKARAGVAVRVVVESPSQYASAIAKVVEAGGKVVGYSSTKGLYIHAKAVIADAGPSDRAVELGSMNYTANSLTRNRELGIVLHDAPDCGLIERQFAADFAGGTPQS
ncbi:phospholipase D-like domain-containing protein [Actinospica sp.]|uniref:phospholipase D-like domain-containing protein n=1 Tax=Actinospica sp. TaxID=1872142 RepID=UPI002B5AC28B|nr:phospholipase D-like domain-containing protein [Actinospica sp.]HWG26142.1 phospholipase D-like domain-containing protein [Actinospica sp.]